MPIPPEANVRLKVEADITKRSKPVRSAKAALTRFGSVLRGTVAPLRTPLMAAPLQDSSLRAGRSGQRLAVVPRPGFAGQYAKGSKKIERNQYSKDSAMKRSAFGWFVPARSLRSLPAQ